MLFTPSLPRRQLRCRFHEAAGAAIIAASVADNIAETSAICYFADSAISFHADMHFLRHATPTTLRFLRRHTPFSPYAGHASAAAFQFSPPAAAAAAVSATAASCFR